MGRSRFVKALVGFMLSAAVVSCSSSGGSQGHESIAANETERDVPSVASTETPRLEAVASVTYHGIYETPVRLVNGRFEGEPFAEGGVSRPMVQLIGNVLETGDLDGDVVEAMLFEARGQSTSPGGE